MVPQSRRRQLNVTSAREAVPGLSCGFGQPRHFMADANVLMALDRVRVVMTIASPSRRWVVWLDQSGCHANQPVSNDRQPYQQQEQKSALLQSWHADVDDHRQEGGQHPEANQEGRRIDGLPSRGSPKAPGQEDRRQDKAWNRYSACEVVKRESAEDTGQTYEHCPDDEESES